MKNLVFNLSEISSNNTQGQKNVAAMSSCRGWCKIRVFKVAKMSSCRGWCKIQVHKV